MGFAEITGTDADLLLREYGALFAMAKPELTSKLAGKVDVISDVPTNGGQTTAVLIPGKVVVVVVVVVVEVVVEVVVVA
jgi:hypothetical protein